MNYDEIIYTMSKNLNVMTISKGEIIYQNQRIK